MDYSPALLGVVILWVLCGIASLLIAQSKRLPNPTSFFLLGVLLGPIGVILALVSKPAVPVDFSGGQSPEPARSDRNVSLQVFLLLAGLAILVAIILDATR